jgi:hypothetical protein
MKRLLLERAASSLTCAWLSARSDADVSAAMAGGGGGRLPAPTTTSGLDPSGCGTFCRAANNSADSSAR